MEKPGATIVPEIVTNGDENHTEIPIEKRDGSQKRSHSQHRQHYHKSEIERIHRSSLKIKRNVDHSWLDIGRNRDGHL